MYKRQNYNTYLDLPFAERLVKDGKAKSFDYVVYLGNKNGRFANYVGILDFSFDVPYYGIFKQSLAFTELTNAYFCSDVRFFDLSDNAEYHDLSGNIYQDKSFSGCNPKPINNNNWTEISLESLGAEKLAFIEKTLKELIVQVIDNKLSGMGVIKK